MTIRSMSTLGFIAAALAAGAILFAAADGAYAGNKSESGAKQAKQYDRSQNPSPTTQPPPSKCKIPKGCDSNDGKGGGK